MTSLVRIKKFEAERAPPQNFLLIKKKFEAELGELLRFTEKI